MFVNKSSRLWPGRLSLSWTTILLTPLPEIFLFVVSLIHDNFKSRARRISYASALQSLCFSNKRARCRRTKAMTIEGKSNRHRLKTNSESKCDMGAIAFSLISHSVSLTPMPALQGAAQLLPLMRIVCVTSFGTLQSVLWSTWRELAAIVFALEFFAPILKGSLIKWFTDSQTAARIIEVGSMKLDLHRLAIKIFQFCAEHSIRLEVQWIPRIENEKADWISRLVAFDDWQITHDHLEELWGSHTVNCFTDYYTAKLPRFFSRFWNPGASGIDFFAQVLSSENCLVVPPVALFARVIHYLSLQKAMATLVVPLWPSSSFWPLLTTKYRSFIKGCFTLKASQALSLGRNLSSSLGSPRFTGEIVALGFEFS